MTRVLLLCTESWFGLKIVYCLRAAGYQVDVIANQSMVFRSSRYVRKFTVFAFPTPEVPDAAFTSAVKTYIDDNSVHCVIGDHVDTQILINEMGAGLGSVARFPGMPTADLKMFDDKWAFNQFLLKNELPGTPSHLIRQVGDVHDPAVSSLGFPLTVKPLSGEGGKGVVKIHTAEDLAAYVAHQEQGGALPLLAQEFLPGHDAGFSFLAIDGKILGWTLQCYRWDEESIEFFCDEKIEKLGCEFARLTGYTGVANLDLRVDDAYRLLGVIECNPRPDQKVAVEPRWPKGRPSGESA